ncbi:MAG: anaerobic ribonucleoside-triphosphate reductase activating protein [Clostridia bacterium]|nr:anaerobic ribonucleoside-triphosphate reductase activating protein [Clostridia bacterium]
MNVQGFQKLTLLDFPGKVACTVFCGGCNLRCPFCHNASLVLSPAAEENRLAEVLDYLKKRQGILEGVCLTGGEPLLQPDLPAFVRSLKSMGYLVKLDTNGAMPDSLASLLEEGGIDHVAMDVKSSAEGYARAVGKSVDLAPFLRSMELLRTCGVSYEFRTTLVKGIHTERDVFGLRELLREDDRFFLQSFKDSGNVLGEGYTAFSEEEMEGFLSVIKEKVPAAVIRGREE